MCHVEMSEKIDTLVASLVVAQKAMETIRKDKKNPAFKSSYADLATVLEAVAPALGEAGIALLQPIATGPDGSAQVTTMLVHSSGQFIRSTVSIKPVKTDPQGFGSAVTYGRRYGLLAMLGVAPDDDDDGNRASGRDDVPPPRQTPAPKADKVNSTALAYVSEWQTYLSNEESEAEIRATWAREKPQRASVGLTDAQVAEMMAAMKTRFDEIRKNANLMMAGE